MAHPTDESKAGTLPDPELNPLLNPLLAANMGRWAEVYFTSAPERRAQAVSDLLQELANHPVPVAEKPADRTEEKTEESRPAPEFQPKDVLINHSSEVDQEALSVCESCGGINLQSQKFCGKCGVRLTAATGGSWWHDTNQQPHAEAIWNKTESRTHSLTREYEQSSQADFEDERNAPANVEADNPRPEDFAWTDSEPHNEETPAHSEGMSSFESQPPRRGFRNFFRRSSFREFRLYVGVSTTIVVGLLLYTMWRRNGESANNAEATSEITQESSPAKMSSAAGANTSAADSGPPAAADKDRAIAKEAPTLEPSQAKPSPRKSPRQSPRKNLNTGPALGASTTAAPGQSGADDLATAEKFLNGAPGTSRDSSQAATWLWRAVAKQNLTATLLLSDLYLRGDGVSKSCDQARLLLDAAAKKGQSAAAGKLRQLPELGCP